MKNNSNLTYLKVSLLGVILIVISVFLLTLIYVFSRGINNYRWYEINLSSAQKQTLDITNTLFDNLGNANNYYIAYLPSGVDPKIFLVKHKYIPAEFVDITQNKVLSLALLNQIKKENRSEIISQLYLQDNRSLWPTEAYAWHPALDINYTLSTELTKKYYQFFKKQDIDYINLDIQNDESDNLTHKINIQISASVTYERSALNLCETQGKDVLTNDNTIGITRVGNQLIVTLLLPSTLNKFALNKILTCLEKINS